MKFETRTIGVFEVLSVHLVADQVFDAGRLRQETLRLVEKGSRRIVIDLGGVDYLYSDSINALVALNRRMLESSGRMGILVPHPKVYDILVRSGLENIMRLYRSEAELQSDSRELMRQSSAWTRPAELLSAATASQMISANVLSPKNPNDLRDTASASQRVPRRRVGSRVEVKPRRRGGRGLDQEQPIGEFQLPPQLPLLPGESSTLRTLSQDSSAFDQIPSSRANQPVPRPEPPLPPPEPTVFHVPDNTQHDGYSTDAWLLSLTPQQIDTSSPAKMVNDVAAGSSSFLPKLPKATAAQQVTDTPSQFPPEFKWDESEISLTDGPPPHDAPPLAPRGYVPSWPAAQPTQAPAFSSPAPVPPVSPWQNQQNQQSPFLSHGQSPGAMTAPPAQHPESVAPPAAVQSIWFDSTLVASTPQAAPVQSAPAPVASVKTEAVSTQDWIHAGAPKNQPVPEAKVAPTPATPTKPEANPLESWFHTNSPTSSVRPVAEPKKPTLHKTETSALDWITPSAPANAAPPAPVHTQKPAPTVHPEVLGIDHWIKPSSAQTPSASVAPAPAPTPASSSMDWITPSSAPPKELSSIDQWITPSSTGAQSDSRTAPAAKASPLKPEPSPLDNWITPAATIPAKPAPLSKSSHIVNPPVGGSAWLESTKPERKPLVSPREPTFFMDLDDLEAQPPNRKPLWIVLIVLGLVAVIGLGIFFSNDSKKSAADVPPGTAPADSTMAAPRPDTTSAMASPETPAKTVAPPTATVAPKAKEKLTPEKKNTSAKVVTKTPSVAPPPPEEEHVPVKVFVTSRPSGAALTLDGSKVGTTPCEVIIKRAGKLEFNLAGYRKQTKDVDPEETRGTINIQLASDGGNSGTGRIYISSAPIGAEIVMGGKVLGKTPRLIDLPTGSQKLTVRSGVLSRTKTLDIQSGTNTAEHFSL